MPTSQENSVSSNHILHDRSGSVDEAQDNDQATSSDRDQCPALKLHYKRPVVLSSSPSSSSGGSSSELVPKSQLSSPTRHCRLALISHRKPPSKIVRVPTRTAHTTSRCLHTRNDSFQRRLEVLKTSRKVLQGRIVKSCGLADKNNANIRKCLVISKKLRGQAESQFVALLKVNNRLEKLVEGLLPKL
jgi:hypothetical protein